MLKIFKYFKKSFKNFAIFKNFKKKRDGAKREWEELNEEESVTKTGRIYS